MSTTDRLLPVVGVEVSRRTCDSSRLELLEYSEPPYVYVDAYFHFIPGQITFAYTAPPTRLLTDGENI